MAILLQLILTTDVAAAGNVNFCQWQLRIDSLNEEGINEGSGVTPNAPTDAVQGVGGPVPLTSVATFEGLATGPHDVDLFVRSVVPAGQTGSCHENNINGFKAVLVEEGAVGQ